MSIIPFFQISPMSKFAIPLVLAVLVWILYNAVGIREQGVGPYFKGIAVPPGVPVGALILVTPIELLSTLVIRPFTLAVRLFANLFAGHMLLVVFSLGTVYLLQVGNFSIIFAPFSFLMALAMTFFEVLVIVLQAYVFTVPTATYPSGPSSRTTEVPRARRGPERTTARCPSAPRTTPPATRDPG